MAAADYAERKPKKDDNGNVMKDAKGDEIIIDPPPELVDYLRTERFGCLPFSGGWKEQPYRFINRGIVYHNVYSAFVAYKNALKDAKGLKGWLKNSKEAMKIVNGVKEARNAIGNGRINC
ncbi:MAG TPA: hypothetical protein VMW84_03060 [Acidobacteriota bacterium]|nr:hypothetical protein [Acidobacteriota bacterium]